MEQEREDIEERPRKKRKIIKGIIQIQIIRRKCSGRQRYQNVFGEHVRTSVE